MERRNFHSGLSVGPEHLNALEDYTDKRTEDLVSSTLGFGVINGFNASMEGGFALGISPGLAYDSQGRRLQLEGGKQINLADLAPTVGLKTVQVGAVFAYTKSEPALDLDGNSILTKWVETVELVKGDDLPTEALLLYEVQLSSTGIVLISPAYSLLETPFAQSKRTEGYSWNGGNPKITAPNGFEVDLLTLATRRAVFDPGQSYRIGDIIWLEPPAYATRQTPSRGGGGGVV